MKTSLHVTGILAAALLTGLLFFTACQKDSNSTPADDTVADTKLAMADDAEADMVFDDVFTTVLGTDDEVGIGSGIGIFGRTTGGSTGLNVVNGTDSVSPCFTVTRVPATPGVFPKTITIDFGTGCTGPDGRTRRGKIITVYTGRMIQPGSEATSTFVNYYVDSLHVEGMHKIKNKSTSAVRVFTLTIVNGKLTRPSGNYTQWSATHTITQTAGLGTPIFPLDDEFDITGTAAGQNHRNIHTATWSHVISNPLHKKLICHWFSSGTITFTRNSHTATLDYGNGACDNTATLTIFGQTFTITLP